MACLGLLAGCFEGSETGNPSKGAAGVLKTLDGLPAANAHVTLLPRDFNPLDLVSKKASPAEAVTDGKGRFQFTQVDSGDYNLEAVDPSTGARAFLKGIAISRDMVELPEQTLKAPGRVSAELAGASDTIGGYIYVTGTTLYGKVASASAAVSLDSVPAGILDSIQYGSLGGSVPARTFAWGIGVRPEEETPAPGPYLAWKHGRTLLLDTKTDGASVTGTVLHFPLRVRLERSTFDFASAAADGSDLRFTDGKGAPLPCEIQSWDAAAGTAEAWVLVDTVYGDSLQTLRMYWGREGAAPLASGSVFALADGYAGAWHLDEDPAGPAPQFRDASGRKNHATAFGYASPGRGAGVVEGGMELDGKAQFAGTRQALANPQVLTLTAWFRTSSQAGGKLLDFTETDTAITTKYRDRHVFMSTDGAVHFGVYPPVAAGQADPNPGYYKTIDSPKPFNDGKWHQVAARLSADGQALFVDGALVASDPASTVAEDITGYWRWGYGALDNWVKPGTDFHFQGSLDEIWIAHAARSDAFIKLSFENLKADSRLLQFP
jgi:hypothetical protein